MVELKGCQQQEMEGKLLFHSRLMLMAQVLVLCWIQFYLAPWKNDSVMFVYAQSLSHVQIFMAPSAVACQAPLSKPVSGQQLFSFLIIDDTIARDCILNGCCNLSCTVLCLSPGLKSYQCLLTSRKSTCHFLQHESLRFFSYFFFLLSLFVLPLGL